MRTPTIYLFAAVISGCGQTSDRDAPADTTPVTLPSSQTAQASIIRSDIAAPVAAPAPLEALELTIGFPDGGTEIGSGEVAQLETLIASPQVAQGGLIRLTAHSDSAGSDAANLAVSRQRGEAVRDWLVERGVTPQRITLIAFGEQNPIRANALPDGSPNQAGRAANRRVEIGVAVAGASPASGREPTLAEEIVKKSPAQSAGGDVATRNGD